MPEALIIFNNENRTDGLNLIPTESTIPFHIAIDDTVIDNVKEQIYEQTGLDCQRLNVIVQVQEYVAASKATAEATAASTSAIQKNDYYSIGDTCSSITSSSEYSHILDPVAAVESTTTTTTPMTAASGPNNLPYFPSPPLSSQHNSTTTTHFHRNHHRQRHRRHSAPQKFIQGTSLTLSGQKRQERGFACSAFNSNNNHNRINTTSSFMNDRRRSEPAISLFPALFEDIESEDDEIEKEHDQGGDNIDIDLFRCYKGEFEGDKNIETTTTSTSTTHTMEWTKNTPSLLETFHPLVRPENHALPCEKLVHSSAVEVTSTLNNVRNFTTSRDILGGKDHASTQHEGNMYYRELIKKNKDEYNSMDDNKKKKDLVRRLYAFLKSDDRRFMKRNDVSDIWIEMDEVMAMKKIGQALREKRNLHSCGTNSHFNFSAEQNTSNEYEDDAFGDT